MSLESKSARNGNGVLANLEKNKSKKIYKIIVIGDSNVGKTCLTYRFCEGKFPTRTEATIGVDFREKTLNIGCQEIKLQLWDTAGQERFRQSMLPHYYRNVHAVVFVYDVTKLTSFNNLGGWLRECDQHYLPPEVPRLLIGNKCDETARVSTQAAQRFADQHSMPVFETSAKDDSRSDHVESIFLTLAHKLVTSRPLMTRSYSEVMNDSSVSLHKHRNGSGGRRRRSTSASVNGRGVNDTSAYYAVESSEEEEEFCGC
ncbi:hypothetical protein BOX15_Mlig015279g1 [Macrostomum lignano]|uniref:Ras-related protein Rab-33B n=1 Tax=Macrostomum lignano TaxID=282301 RepID=A0A267E776_9PLAT|nr:hypothetical protein BOX15_Mlig015279g1 [Macrostomum lignano]